MDFFSSFPNLNFNAVRLWVYFTVIFIFLNFYLLFLCQEDFFKAIFFNISCPLHLTVFMFVFILQPYEFCSQYVSIRMPEFERQIPPDSYILRTDGRIPWTKRYLCCFIPGHSDTCSVSFSLQSTIAIIQSLSLLLPMNVFLMEKSSKLTKYQYWCILRWLGNARVLPQTSRKLLLYLCSWKSGW